MMWNKKMHRILLPAAAALVLTIGMSMSALAELVPALDEYNVSFNANNKMESNFKTEDMYNQFSGMQPGDYTDIVLNLKNNNDETVDWYMTNKVLSSLEDTRSADGLAGGAYTYVLTFQKTGGEPKTLFSSDTVGGESVSAAGEGLHEATDALKDWLYLETFKKGEGGAVTLRVALDGETQGNDYQDTLAELQMQFAVELVQPEEESEGTPGGGGAANESQSITEEKEETKTVKKTIKKKVSGSSSTGRKSTVVQTGDYTSTLPYIIAAGVSGLILLILAIYSLRERRRQKGGAA